MIFFSKKKIKVPKLCQTEQFIFDGSEVTMRVQNILTEKILLSGLETWCGLNGSLGAFTAALSAEQKQSLDIDADTPAHAVTPSEPYSANHPAAVWRTPC